MTDNHQNPYFCNIKKNIRVTESLMSFVEKYDRCILAPVTIVTLMP